MYSTSLSHQSPILSRPLAILVISLLVGCFFVSLDSLAPSKAHAVSAASVSVTLDRTSGPKAGMTRVKFEGDGMRNVSTINHDGNAISFTRVTDTNYAVLLPDVSGTAITQPVIRLIYQNGSTVDLDRGTYTYTNDPRVIDTLTADRTQVLPGERPTLSSTLPSGYQLARWVDFVAKSGIATSSSGVLLQTWSEVMTCSDTSDRTLEVRSYDSFYNPGFVQPAKLDGHPPADASATNERFASRIFITYRAGPDSTFCKPPANNGSGSSSATTQAPATISLTRQVLRLPGFAGFSNVLTQTQLKRLREFLTSNKGLNQVQIVGKTSSFRTTNYLKSLANSRIKSAWRVISAKNPESRLIDSKTKTDLGIRASNRAVEIHLTK